MKNKQAILIAFAAVMLLSMGLFGCHRQKLPQHQFILAKTSFKNLSGWEKDDQKQALDVLQKSCAVIAKQNPNQQFGKLILQGGKVESWQKICTAIDKVEANDSSSARKFFESWFEPYRVYDDSSTQGLFTGYYLPLLNCSLKQNKHYSTPVHAIPDDWVKADLSLFDKKLKGKTIVGQVKGHALRPYPTRASIVRGAIPKSSKVLVWCDDKVNVAFAHIQGSAIVRLPDGKKFLIGYEGANGRPYTSISKVLIKKNELTLQNSSMQDIRAWFLAHPKQIDAILDYNASYVFFRVLENDSPLGSQQVPLTPKRSLAVDKRYIPLGMPVWLDTVIPQEGSKELEPFQQLLIAQDTGGAIKGIIRGDVYWGSGDYATFVAGHMKSQGGYWLLLPRSDLN